jgi:RimJ/RimL family protein N-acetyltransferase
MEIRELTPADSAIFQELRLYALQESPEAFGSSYEEEKDRPLDAVAERLSAENNHVFGAFTGTGQLIGLTGLYREPRTKTHHKAQIWGVYVAPGHRGRGAGSALMEAALSRARELGLRQVNLGVNTASHAAVRLYESCGFERFGPEKEAFKIGEDYYDSAYMALKF